MKDLTEIQKKLSEYISDQVFKGLDKFTETTENADYSPLEQALRSGELTFNQGVFSGKLNATISRELQKLGAKFIGGEFRITKDQLPENITKAIEVSGVKFEKKLDKITAILDKNSIAEPKLSLFDNVRSLLFAHDSTLSEKLEKIGIKEELDDKSLDNISLEYTQNLDREIQGAAAEEVAKFREEVQKIYLAGGREKQLVDLINKKKIGVAGRAEFIARQEMNLMASAYTTTKMLDAGSIGYYWKAGPNARPDHKRLDDGEVYPWNKPPVTNTKTGARNNPGEDYNCNCVAVPAF